MNEINEYNETIFESIKHVDKYGVEFWYARELQKIREYSQWRRFNELIEKAMIACNHSKINALDHFAVAGKTIKMPKNAAKKIIDYYACYLIVQNGDPRKKVIALG